MKHGPAPPREITGLGFGSAKRINPAYVEWLEWRYATLLAAMVAALEQPELLELIDTAADVEPAEWPEGSLGARLEAELERREGNGQAS